jgi:hypothetical protein
MIQQELTSQHSFTASGSYTSPGFGPGTATVLVVAGGGAGGGSRTGGGGGAGGYRIISCHPIPASAVTVTVGGGGGKGTSCTSGSIWNSFNFLQQQLHL